eukprot:43065_1
MPHSISLALSTLYLAVMFATMLLSRLFHHLVKEKIFPRFLRLYGSYTALTDTEMKTIGTDHLINMMIHAFHTIHLSVISFIVVMIWYDSREQNFFTVAPPIILCTFYMHELNVKALSIDIIVHHCSYPTILLLSFYYEMTILIDVYDIILFGHVFHFVPYLMYKLKFDPNLVYKVSKVSIWIYFVVNVIGYTAISLFIFLTNWDFFIVHHIFIGLLFAVAFAAMSILQYYFWFDILKHTKKLQAVVQAASESNFTDNCHKPDEENQLGTATLD